MDTEIDHRSQTPVTKAAQKSYLRRPPAIFTLLRFKPRFYNRRATRHGKHTAKTEKEPHWPQSYRKPSQDNRSLPPTNNICTGWPKKSKPLSKSSL